MWSKPTYSMALTVLSGAISLAGNAHAATCEQGFQVVGDPRNGQVFTAEVTVPGLRPSSALGQLRKLALDEGNNFVSGDVITAEEGRMYVMQTNLKLPVVTSVIASSKGKVLIGTKLARGQTMPEDGARAAMCGWLNQLKPGKPGEAIAEAARLASRFDVPVNTTAVILSTELGKEAKRLQREISTAPLKGLFSGSSAQPDVAALYQPLIAKYFGRRFVIDGQVYTAGPNKIAKTFEVGYLVTKMKGLGGIGGRQANDFNNTQFTVTCTLAPDQLALGATLRTEDWVKLSGTVDDIDLGGIQLRDCRQAK